MNDIQNIATKLKECAQAWEPNACLLGNVTAHEIERLCDSILNKSTINKKYIGDLCQCCWKEYYTLYRVPNCVWQQIAPHPDQLGDYEEHQFGGLLCMSCADECARKVGIKLFWEADLDWRNDGQTKD